MTSPGPGARRRDVLAGGAGLFAATAGAAPRMPLAGSAGGFRNPVLAGDHADPSVLRDGDHYYATFSSFLYYPGVVIWRSRDLVRWTPVTPVLLEPLGSVFAVDLARHDGRFFAYIPVFVPPKGEPNGPPFKIYVCHASSMEGPWSAPIDMDIDGHIDPGHAVGEDGRRYLFLNDGHRVRISDDGLRRAGPVEKVYGGWPIPPDWVVEGFALEGPKLLRRDGWFFLFSGEGGTAGPPTSHMVVVARSRSIDGPWENCPHNPIVHSADRREPWWSRGHATPVQGPAGDWWLAYHGYANGRRTLGRQMLLEPMGWDAQGWPVARGGTLADALPRPAPARPADGAGLVLSDDFEAPAWGTRWSFFDPRPGYRDRARVGGGALRLKGQGRGPADSGPIAVIAGDARYVASVIVEHGAGGEAGLLLFYDDKLFCGIGIGERGLRLYRLGSEQMFPPPPRIGARRLALAVRNDEDVATFFFRESDGAWRIAASFEVSGYNHNIGEGFLSLRPALYAAGGGEARFARFRYRAGAGLPDAGTDRS